MRYLLHLFLIMQCLGAFSQEKLDGIIGVVGEELVLKSELDIQKEQYLSSGMKVGENTACVLYEELLFAKLLIAQSKLDSLIISEDQVEQELDRRMRYFINQFGSREKLEEFYDKSILEIKKEFADDVRQQLIVQQMRSKITSGVKITPAEVREFYNSIPRDSLPFINAEIEVAQIVKKAPINEEEKQKVKKRLEEFRDRIMAGEDFGTLAYLYSEDPGSARENGELGYMARSELVPEFAAVAFDLQPGEVSEIVETQFGFHLIKALDRRGQEMNLAHILLSPKVQTSDMIKAKMEVDSIADLIKNVDTLDFETAAKLFSDDKDTKYNGGLITNAMTGTSQFEMDQISQIDPGLFIVVENMKEGDMSEAEVAQLSDGSKGYRIIKLISYTEPHRANLNMDYQRISTVAQAEKQNNSLVEWVGQKAEDFYIRIDDQYKSCDFKYDWKTNTN